MAAPLYPATTIHHSPFVLSLIMARSKSHTTTSKPKRKELERRIAELELANQELDGVLIVHPVAVPLS
jgi:hypothetical protein